MKGEAAEALIDLRTVYGELYPHQNTDNVRFTDTQIAQVVLFRREQALMEERIRRVVKRTADPE